MTKVILSAPEAVLAKARVRAEREGTTLNEQFFRWISEYAHYTPHEFNETRYEQTMAIVRSTNKGKFARMPTRDEMNMRR
jgi:hypothetical protein